MQLARDYVEISPEEVEPGMLVVGNSGGVARLGIVTGRTSFEGEPAKVVLLPSESGQQSDVGHHNTMMGVLLAVPDATLRPSLDASSVSYPEYPRAGSLVLVGKKLLLATEVVNSGRTLERLYLDVVSGELSNKGGPTLCFHRWSITVPGSDPAGAPRILASYDSPPSRTA